VRVLVVVVAITVCSVLMPVVASGSGERGAGERESSKCGIAYPAHNGCGAGAPGSGKCGYVYPPHNGHSPYGVGTRYFVQTSIPFSCAVARKYALRLAVEKPVGRLGKLTGGPPGYGCYAGAGYPQESGGCLKKPLGSSGQGIGWESE
jgi:hypothetical protein